VATRAGRAAGTAADRRSRRARARDEVEQDAGDTAGKVGLSVLTVALSVGAAIAPFFLF